MNSKRTQLAKGLLCILLIGYVFVLVLIVRSVNTENTDVRSFAKTAAKTCGKGTLYCGVTDSCMSYNSCVAAGKPKADAAKAKTQALAKLISITPASTVKNNSCPGDMYRCSCGCFTQAQFNSIQTVNCSDMCDASSKHTTSTPLKSPTMAIVESINTTTPQIVVTGTSPAVSLSINNPIVPISTHIASCPINTFQCSCGCYTASQFKGAATDKCSDMCGGIVHHTPAAIAMPTLSAPIVSSISPGFQVVTQTYIQTSKSLSNNGSYYSQKDPAYASQSIPGQEKYTFVQAGCGEVTVANILTNAGTPTNPYQASTLVNPYKGDKGTSYQQNIGALEKKGFTATLYPASFETLPSVLGPKDVVWLSVRASDDTYTNLGHHTYIDGYTLDKGTPVYNLRDPFFGSDMKCTPDGDRALSCANSEKRVHLDVPLTSDSAGGTAAVILTPPENGI